MGGQLLCHSGSNEDVDWEKDLERMEEGGRAKRALDPGCGSDILEEREKTGGLGWRSSGHRARQGQAVVERTAEVSSRGGP